MYLVVAGGVGVVAQCNGPNGIGGCDAAQLMKEDVSSETGLIHYTLHLSSAEVAIVESTWGMLWTLNSVELKNVWFGDIFLEWLQFAVHQHMCNVVGYFSSYKTVNIHWRDPEQWLSCYQSAVTMSGRNNSGHCWRNPLHHGLTCHHFLWAQGRQRVLRCCLFLYNNQVVFPCMGTKTREMIWCMLMLNQVVSLSMRETSGDNLVWKPCGTSLFGRNPGKLPGHYCCRGVSILILCLASVLIHCGAISESGGGCKG